MDREKTVASGLVARPVGPETKVGETLLVVIKPYGEIYRYHEEMMLQPTDRLVELEVKSVKAVKKQEFIDANQQ